MDNNYAFPCFINMTSNKWSQRRPCSRWFDLDSSYLVKEHWIPSRIFSSWSEQLGGAAVNHDWTFGFKKGGRLPLTPSPHTHTQTNPLLHYCNLRAVSADGTLMNHFCVDWSVPVSTCCYPLRWGGWAHGWIAGLVTVDTVDTNVNNSISNVRRKTPSPKLAQIIRMMN